MSCVRQSLQLLSILLTVLDVNGHDVIPDGRWVLYNECSGLKWGQFARDSKRWGLLESRDILRFPASALAATDPSYASKPYEVILLSQRGLETVLQKRELAAEARALEAVWNSFGPVSPTTDAVRTALAWFLQFQVNEVCVLSSGGDGNTHSKRRHSWKLGVSQS